MSLWGQAASEKTRKERPVCVTRQPWRKEARKTPEVLHVFTYRAFHFPKRTFRSSFGALFASCICDHLGTYYVVGTWGIFVNQSLRVTIISQLGNARPNQVQVHKHISTCDKLVHSLNIMRLFPGFFLVLRFWQEVSINDPWYSRYKSTQVCSVKRDISDQ